MSSGAWVPALAGPILSRSTTQISIQGDYILATTSSATGTSTYPAGLSVYMYEPADVDWIEVDNPNTNYIFWFVNRSSLSLPVLASIRGTFFHLLTRSLFILTNPPPLPPNEPTGRFSG